MRLENKVALITGGYGGMGRASARLFCQEGATVFVAGRSHERGEAFVQELKEAARGVGADDVHQDVQGAGRLLQRRDGGVPLVLVDDVILDEVRCTIAYSKVAEFQARGVIHLHVPIRLDGPGDPMLLHQTCR